MSDQKITISTNVLSDAGFPIELDIKGMKARFGILLTTGEVYRYTLHEGLAIGLRWEAPAYMQKEYKA